MEESKDDLEKRINEILDDPDVKITRIGNNNDLIEWGIHINKCVSDDEHKMIMGELSKAFKTPITDKIEKE